MTTKVNQSYYRNQSHEVQKMIRAIRRQLSISALVDVRDHGADSGFSGFIYTAECVRFYNRHEDAIWQLLRSNADDMGYDSATALIATFKRKDMLDDPDQFKNLLAWFALEEVARGLTDY